MKIEFINNDYDLKEIESIAVHLESVGKSVDNSGLVNSRSVLLNFVAAASMSLLSLSSSARSLNSGVAFTNTVGNPIEYVSELDNNICENYKSFWSDYKEISGRNFTLDELITKIVSFKSLNSNWDGYGSIPLEVRSASNAILLVNLLPDDLAVKVDEIYPNTNGTVTLTWSNLLNEELSVEIGNNTMSYYYKSLGNGPEFFNKVKIVHSEILKMARLIKKI